MRQRGLKMPNVKESRENKKGGFPHHRASRHGVLDNTSNTKNKKSFSLCQLKREFKRFAKESKDKWDKFFKTTFESRKKDPETRVKDLDRIEQDFKESTKSNKEQYIEIIASIRNGKTEKLLKHLNIIQNGKFKTDNLKTALNLIKLLINHTENHDDNIFIFPDWELTRDQVNHLQFLLMGKK